MAVAMTSPNWAVEYRGVALRLYRTEDALQSACLKAARGLGFWVVRTGRNSRKHRRDMAESGEDGIPDTQCVDLGWIEIKQPGEELDPDQIKWHQKALSRGVRVATAWSVREYVEILFRWRDGGEEC